MNRNPPTVFGPFHQLVPTPPQCDAVRIAGALLYVGGETARTTGRGAGEAVAAVPRGEVVEPPPVEVELAVRGLAFDGVHGADDRAVAALQELRRAVESGAAVREDGYLDDRAVDRRTDRFDGDLLLAEGLRVARDLLGGVDELLAAELRRVHLDLHVVRRTRQVERLPRVLAVEVDHAGVDVDRDARDVRVGTARLVGEALRDRKQEVLLLELVGLV